MLSCVFPNEAIFAQKILLALLPVRVNSSDLGGDTVLYIKVATSPKNIAYIDTLGVLGVFLGCYRVIHDHDQMSHFYIIF